MYKSTKQISGNAKAEKTANGQTGNKAQSHEAPSGLPLVVVDMSGSGHHAIGAEPTVCEAKEQLKEHVEGVGGDQGAPPADVASEVDGYEEGAGDGAGEEDARGVGPPADQAEGGEHGGQTAGQVAQ
ncbi:hypothetical protein GMORB2_2297, partial [Geosmithia morbida]